ncbi:MAG: ArsA-related P-loop ATPase [Pseudomonadota bacterium]
MDNPPAPHYNRGPERTPHTMEPPIHPQLRDLRAILVTGKGGVGRTTVAAAVARAAAAAGRRVLLAEFEEPSHVRRSPLAACFRQAVLPNSPALIEEGVWGVTLDSDLGIQLFLESVFKVPVLARLALRLPALRRMLHSGPSFHEMGLLYHMLYSIRQTRPDGSPRYELMVLDMPATGHTLAITGLPAILLRLVRRGPIAEALKAGLAIFSDPRQAAAWVVTLPEPLPVSECLDLLGGLRRTDIPVGLVIANRVPQDPFTAEEHLALDEILSLGQPRGLTQVDRIRRAESSLDRLGRVLEIPLLRVAEVEHGEPHQGVSRQLVAELA